MGATSKGIGTLSERSKSRDSICHEREHPDPSHTQVTLSDADGEVIRYVFINTHGKKE